MSSHLLSLRKMLYVSRLTDFTAKLYDAAEIDWHEEIDFSKVGIVWPSLYLFHINQDTK